MVTQPAFSFSRTPDKLGLYPIVDTIEWITRLLTAGVKTLQLRIKESPAKQTENDISAAITLAERYNARLFINDHWSLAIKHGAYGIHLGQEDLINADLAAIAQAGLRFGISTRNDTELAHAITLRPSYIAIGHIFPTQSKKMDSMPQGLETLKRHVAMASGLPAVAIGGISIDRVPQVLNCGVSGIAVISAITQAPDWRQATTTLLQLIEGRTE